MSDARTGLTWAAVWLAVVVVAATSVWFVIARAGDGVTSSAGFVGASDAPPPEPRNRTSRSPSATPSRRPQPSPSPSASSAAPDPPSPTRRSASGPGGSVTAQCDGSAVSLVAATPRSGYGAEVEDTGPDRVRVDFESDDARTRIEATCAGGGPVFEIDD